MTIRTVVEKSDPRFIWLDVVDPTREELSELVADYGLHPLSVNDCLDPEHLPKYEVSKTQEGEVQVPKYDVQGPDVKVSQTEKEVTLPKVTTEKETITLPKVEVTPAPDRDDNNTKK